MVDADQAFKVIEQMEAQSPGKLEDEARAIRMELGMLRRFFDCWEALHAIPNDKEHRRKSEQAAQLLVDTAHAVRRFRSLGGKIE
jgi:hypothetical protein